MMNGGRRPWMHAALRAHQIRTLDNQQKARVALVALGQAQQQAAQSAQSLAELVDCWARQRRAGASDQNLDLAYQRFHALLRRASTEASDARQSCQCHVDTAIADLQKSHAVLRTLERVARETTSAHERAVRAKALQLAMEAWLPGSVAQPAAIPLQPTQAVMHLPGARAGARAELTPRPRHAHPQHEVNSDDTDPQ